ncbi:MAG: hypothetical protein Q9219_006879 [cf. Caloplaca sp. 3 TL-2023]
MVDPPFHNSIPGGIFGGALLFWKFPSPPKVLEGGPRRLAQIDWPGVILSLAGSIILVFPLEQGGVQYSWSSAIIISTFVVGERANRCRSGFLTGFPFMVIIIFLPQRFQIENNLSPVDAGVKMLALLLLSAFGAGLAGFICSKKNLSWYLLVLSNALQVIGLGLLSSVPTSDTILARQYGYQVILGLGFGLGLSSLVIVSRVEVGEQDLAVTMGAITQTRVLGGVVGIAIAQVVLSSAIRTDLPAILTQPQIDALLQSAASIAELAPEQIGQVQKVYGDAYNAQTRLVMYFAIGSLVVSAFAFRRHPRSFADAGKNEEVEVGLEEPPVPVGVGLGVSGGEHARTWNRDDDMEGGCAVMEDVVPPVHTPDDGIRLVRQSRRQSRISNRTSITRPLSLHIAPDSFAEMVFSRVK